MRKTTQDEGVTTPQGSTPRRAALARACASLLALCVPLASCASDDEPVGDRSALVPDASTDAGATQERDVASPERDQGSPGDSVADVASDAPEGGDAPADADREVDAGPAPPEVPILVAQGKLGRTLVSCDGGLSWGGDRNMAAEGHAHYCGVEQPDAECGRTPCQQHEKGGSCVQEQVCSCSDHQPGSPTALVYGGGWFVATFGHGSPGVVWRSRDGIAWDERTIENRGFAKINTFKGAAYGDGVFVLGHPRFVRSEDGGESWQRLEAGGGGGGEGAGLTWLEQVHYSASRSIMIGFGRTGIARSRDLGLSWTDASDIPEACVGEFGQVTQHGDTIVFTRSNRDNRGASLCISRDGGETFAPLPNFTKTATVGAAHDGTKFHLWSSGRHFTSADGERWDDEEVSGAPQQMKAIVYDPLHKHFVSTSRHGYERQRFAYSEDGSTWTQIPLGDFPSGPDIRAIVFGYAPRGFQCPD